MSKPKTPPCIGHDHETEILEEIGYKAYLERRKIEIEEENIKDSFPNKLSIQTTQS